MVPYYLRAVLVGGGAEDLLRRGPPRPVGGADADPPVEEEEEVEDDRAGHAARDVGGCRLLLAELAGERARAMAAW